MRKLIALFTFIFSLSTIASTYVVEFTRPLKKSIASAHSLELFDNIGTDYFSRLYITESNLSKKELIKKLSQIGKIENIEQDYNVAAMSIEPGDASRRKETDSLFQYQWGLVSQNQVVSIDIDDINSIQIKDEVEVSGPSIIDILGDRINDIPPAVLAQLLKDEETKKKQSFHDINWIEYVKNKSSFEKKKEVVVAIVDSGVDVSHPDLKHALKLNDQECDEDGRADPNDMSDDDGNGVPGDCYGWDFTVHPKNPLAKFPKDDTGHGTHVASLIAANNNDKSIVGIDKDIKILPVRVLLADEGSAAAKKVAMTTRIGRGILYSIKRKVDVINLSLGWLKQMDTKYVREAVIEALKRNIVVVAAAGNSGSTSQIFPCTYDGVICVGATQIDGKMASFSNTGGAVDILAPGDHILGLHPVDMIPEIFTIQGHELRSGTSQSAPFVSATVALLKANNPEITFNEIRARLFAGAKPRKVDEVSKTQSGLLDLHKSLTLEKQTVIRPVFNFLDEVNFKMTEKTFKIGLPIINLWADAKNVKIKVELLNSGVELIEDTFEYDELLQDKSKLLKLDGKITDLKASRNVTIKVSIAHGENTAEEFYHEFKLVRLLTDNIGVTQKSVVFTDQKKPLGLFRDNKLRPLITTFEGHFSQSGASYFLRRNITKGFELSLFHQKGEQIVEGKKTLVFNNTSKLLSLKKLDLNYDGEDDIFVRTIAMDDEGKETHIVYSYFNMQGEELFGENSHFKFVPEDVSITNEYNFVPKVVEGIGRIAVPVILERGKLPEFQQPTGFFAERDERKMKRLYLLEPISTDSGFEIRPRVLDTPDFVTWFKEENNITYGNTLVHIGGLAQSRESFESGLMEFVVSVGFGYLRDEYLFKVTENGALEATPFQLNGLRVETDATFKAPLIMNDDFIRNGASGYVGLYDTKRARVSVINSNKVESLNLELEDKMDNIEGFSYGVMTQNGIRTLFQTQKGLVWSEKNDGVLTNLFQKVQKFDFIPGTLLSQAFYPILTKVEDKLNLAVMFDASIIGSNSVYAVKKFGEKLVEPIESSVLLPPNCKSLDPTELGDNEGHRYTILCLSRQGEWSFKYLKLNPED